MAWIDDLAAALGEQPLSRDETTELLGLAREVAHRVERKMTPLAAFLAGTAAGHRVAGGETRVEALRGISAKVAGLLPEAPPGDEQGSD